MRLILVDSESELVRCDYPVQLAEFDTPLERLCKVAASLLEGDEVEPEHFEFGSYRPYQDVDGYFVFVAHEDSEIISPTTLDEVMGRFDCIGYVRRAPERHVDLDSENRVVHRDGTSPAAGAAPHQF